MSADSIIPGMKTKLIYISAMAGIISGVLLDQHTFLADPVNFVIWGGIGVALGLFVEDEREAIWSGIIYGVFLVLSFELRGLYRTFDNVFGFLSILTFIGIIGAVCGLLCVYIGYRVRKYFGRK